MDSARSGGLDAASLTGQVSGARRRLRGSGVRAGRPYSDRLRPRHAISAGTGGTHIGCRSQGAIECAEADRVHQQAGADIRSERAPAVVRVGRKSRAEADCAPAESKLKKNQGRWMPASPASSVVFVRNYFVLPPSTLSLSLAAA